MKILFLHIPKTGGTTLRHLINYIYPYYEICDCYFKDPLQTKELIQTASENPLKKIIYGHFDMGVRQYLTSPFTFFTILRDPVERILSFYHFLKIDISLEEFLLSKDFYYVPPLFFNSQTADLCADEPFVDKGRLVLKYPHEPIPPQSPPNLEKAKENIEKYCSVVGITEMYDETLFMLKKSFSWGDFTYKKENVSKNRLSKTDLPNHVIELIMEKNQLDIELYQWAKKRFIKQIQELNPEDQQELLKFKMRQKQNS